MRLGMAEHQIDGRVQNGRWFVLRRGVYLLAGAPTSYEQSVLGACLAVGEVAVASHLTACALWGLVTPAPNAIDVLTPFGPRVRLEGVHQHRTAAMHLDDITRRHRVPATSAARSLVDVAKMFDPRKLGLIVDDADRRRLLRLSDLRRCHERLAQRGRARATMAEVLASRAPGWDPGGSERELWVIDVLRAAGLAIPVQQHRVRIHGRTFFLDLAYPELKIVIEFDGWDFHRSFSAFHGDRTRTRLLVAEGWIVIPVTAQVTEAELVRDVAAVLARCGQSTGV